MTEIIIFTDGASLGNPGPGGWGWILKREGRVVEGGGASRKATNNEMELRAVLESLEEAQKLTSQSAGQITFYTDSKYVVDGASKWMKGWKRRGWETQDGNPVANITLWKDLDEKIQSLQNIKIEWCHVPGHEGIPGNERADQIASAFAAGEEPSFYRGVLEDYPVSLQKPSFKKIQDGKQNRKSKKGKAYSYLSLVNGKVQRHQSWGECQQRVQGISNAKYRKATSLEEEKKILSQWGLVEKLDG